MNLVIWSFGKILSRIGLRIILLERIWNDELYFVGKGGDREKFFELCWVGVYYLYFVILVFNILIFKMRKVYFKFFRKRI